MKIFKPRFSRLSTLLSLWLLMSAFPTSLYAQDSEAGLIRIYEMTLRPESVKSWTQLQQNEAIPALLEGGYDWVDVWRSGGAGNVYYRSILVPINDLMQLDEPAMFVKVLGEEKASSLLERNNAMVSSINTLIIRTRPDLSFGVSPEKPGIGVLTTVTVASGRTEEFEHRLRTSVSSELKESNVHSFRVGQVLYGGQGNQYFTLLEFKSSNSDNVNRASPQGHPSTLEWALGIVGVARIAEQSDSPILSLERMILRHDGELSTR